MRAINAIPVQPGGYCAGQGRADRCVLHGAARRRRRRATAATPDVKLGLGGYYYTLKGGDGPLPVAEFVTGEAAGKAAPTNQWYSSVMFQRWSQPLHAHPMTYRATEQGFELGLPSKRHADVGGSLELSYPHVPAIVVVAGRIHAQGCAAVQVLRLARPGQHGGGPGEALTATVLHGSPFSYYELSKGDVRFRLAALDNVIADPTQAGQDPRVAAVTIAGQSYAIFAPTGSSWEWKQPTELVLRLPENARYFSVAGLPDASESTLRDFHAVAYAFPTDTRVEWSYDEAASKVRSVYRVQTAAKEGENLATLMGLYPHHWSAVVSDHPSKYGYDSVRGRIRLVPGNSFTLERTYNGFVPMWAGLQDPANKDSVGSLLVGDMAKAPQMYNKMGRGTYWIGKGLGANAQLLSVAEVEGKTKMRDQLLAQLEDRLESWFDGQHSTYFAQDSTLGTFVGVPEEYGSVKAMNDHHFHYGYCHRRGRHVAPRGPEWASPSRTGAAWSTCSSRHREQRRRSDTRLPVPAQLRSVRRARLGLGRRELRLPATTRSPRPRRSTPGPA